MQEVLSMQEYLSCNKECFMQGVLSPARGSVPCKRFCLCKRFYVQSAARGSVSCKGICHARVSVMQEDLSHARGSGIKRAESLTIQWLVIRYSICISYRIGCRKRAAIKGNTLIMHVFEHSSHLRAGFGPKPPKLTCFH